MDELAVISLTERGEDAVAPDTGDVQAAGGEDHDDGVYEAEQALTIAGFNAQVVTQDRSEQPDGRATHPELDEEFVIEVETTTPENPAKVLTNLRKAQEEEAIPLFVVRPDEDDSFWAERIERILSPPVKELSSGETQLYTFDAPLEVDQITSDQQLAALRPVTGEDDTRRSVWQRDDETEEVVLLDSDGTEYAQVEQIESISQHDVPAVYTYDPDANEHIVVESDTTHTYDTKEAFVKEWVTIKKPFVPEVELPVPEYDRDSYGIVILPEGGEPVVYESDGSTSPLSSLVDENRLHLADEQNDQQSTPDVDESAPPAEETPTEPETNSEPESTTEVTAEAAEQSDPASSIADLDEEEAFGVFVDQHISEADDETDVPKQEVYSAYESWATDHGLEVPTNQWISQQLSDRVNIGRGRIRIDGDPTRTFTGITLDKDGDSE